MTVTTTPDPNQSKDTGAFAPFEWLLAMRYLRPKSREGLISVIAMISFLGIMVGVATLIAVLGVMNGFREELYTRLLGINGHVEVYRLGGDFKDYAAVMARLKTVPSVRSVAPCRAAPNSMLRPSKVSIPRNPSSSAPVWLNPWKSALVAQCKF
jgi:ABC-type lipoprotein release transport system permease subunit